MRNSDKLLFKSDFSNLSIIVKIKNSQHHYQIVIIKYDKNNNDITSNALLPFYFFVFCRPR